MRCALMEAGPDEVDLELLVDSLIPLGTLALKSGSVADLGLVAGHSDAGVVPALIIEPHATIDFDVTAAVRAFREWTADLRGPYEERKKAPDWRDLRPRRLANLGDLREGVRSARHKAERSIHQLYGQTPSLLRRRLEALPQEPDERRRALRQLWADQPWIFSTPLFHMGSFDEFLDPQQSWPIGDLPPHEAAFVVLRTADADDPFRTRAGHPFATSVDPDAWQLYRRLREAVDDDERLVRRFVAATDGPERPLPELDERFRRISQTGRRREQRAAVLRPESLLIPVWPGTAAATADHALVRWLRSDAALRCFEALAGGQVEGFFFPLAGRDWAGFRGARQLPFWRARDIRLESPDDRAGSRRSSRHIVRGDEPGGRGKDDHWITSILTEDAEAPHVVMPEPTEAGFAQTPEQFFHLWLRASLEAPPAT